MMLPLRLLYLVLQCPVPLLGFLQYTQKLVRVQTLFRELTICHAVNGELKLLSGTELKVALV